MQSIVVIDQEVRDTDGSSLDILPGYTGPARHHRLVMAKDGILTWLDDEAIPAGALVVGDYNALAVRNGRSLAQAWNQEDRDAFVARLEARGCELRTFSNFIFGKGKVEGGPLAAVHLLERCADDPNWTRSSTRPLRPRGNRAETRRLWDDAKWDFRQAEDAQKYGVFPAWYDAAVGTIRDALTREEEKALCASVGRLEKAPRRVLAVYLSVRDLDGNVRLRDNGQPVTVDFARRYIARLHGQARGVGGPIRACLRSIGNGKDSEARRIADRAFTKAARALLDA